MPRLTQVLGAATVAYSVAIIAKPEILARPCRLVSKRGTVSPGMRTLISGIGARDAAIGTAMMFVPAGPSLRVVTAVRVASDWSDAIGFGTQLPDKSARVKVAAFAFAWGALCAVAALKD